MFKDYKHHFELLIYVVVFIIFFALAMYLVTGGSISRHTVDAFTQ